MTEPSFEQSQASMRPHEDPVSRPKILLISSLALATLVPTFFVSGLIAEREARQGVVQSEFTRNWGPPQELRSPTFGLVNLVALIPSIATQRIASS